MSHARLISAFATLTALVLMLPSVGFAQNKIITVDGYDPTGNDFKNLSNSNLNACKSACLREGRCKTFVFNEVTKKCWMKTGSPGTFKVHTVDIDRRKPGVGWRYSHSELNKRVKMGIKVPSRGNAERNLTSGKPGWDLRGTTIATHREVNLTVCRALCLQNTRCKGYSHQSKQYRSGNVNVGTCWLKANTSTGFAKRGVYSATRDKNINTKPKAGPRRANSVSFVNMSFATIGSRNPSKKRSVRNNVDCKNTCLVDAECMAYSAQTLSRGTNCVHYTKADAAFTISASSRGLSGIILPRAIGSRQPSVSDISGLRFQHNGGTFKRVGSGTTVYDPAQRIRTVSGATLIQCRMLCQADGACHGITYRAQSKSCSLFRYSRTTRGSGNNVTEERVRPKPSSAPPAVGQRPRTGSKA